MVGLIEVNETPPLMEKAAVQFAVTKTTPPPLAPLGSAHDAGGTPGCSSCRRN